MKKPIRNIAIVAHVDAGKTTTTEQMLYAAGMLREAGSVDKGTTATDSLSIERERGISIRLATDSLSWNDTQINLIDTPGHIDFCAEVERALLALDGAVLVVSAVEGVQGHTISIFQALTSLKIPTIIFINKIDRVGADVERVMAEISSELKDGCLLMQSCSNQAQSNAELNHSWNETNYLQNAENDFFTEIVEALVELDDDMLESFLEGEQVEFTKLEQLLMRATASNERVPVFLGVAKNAIGIKQLMDAMISYLPSAKMEEQLELSAVVFKIEFDKTLGKLAHFRVFKGSMKARDIINNATRSKQDKVSQLKRVQRGKYIDINQLSAGDIGVVSGLDYAQVGDIYGEQQGVSSVYSLSAPLLTVQVKPNIESEFSQLAQALKELSEEDPLLSLEWLSQLRELHIKISGKIQIEVLQAILQERFSLGAKFSKPSIIYKETPAKNGFGFERYWMPKPCWAILKLRIEPGERGSGVVYTSQVSVNDIAAKYQNEIEATINQALSQGIKGWQVTDLKLTLVEGEDHNIHTRPGDYIIATPMAIMNGLVETDTNLLEPILSFTISASLDLLGSITSDITKMRGDFDSPEIVGDIFKLRGKLPAATSMDYSIQLASISGGKAKISTQLSSYEVCSLNNGRTVEYRGVSPLDRDKWILQARGALSVN